MYVLPVQSILSCSYLAITLSTKLSGVGTGGAGGANAPPPPPPPMIQQGDLAFPIIRLHVIVYKVLFAQEFIERNERRQAFLFFFGKYNQLISQL